MKQPVSRRQHTGSSRSGRLPVLIYHHVGPPRAGTHPSLTVTPERFRRDLGWLQRRRFHAATEHDVRGWLHHARPLPPRSVLVTFDDAYADLAEHAFPALRDAGMAATVFVVTGLLGQTNVWDAEVGGEHRLLDGERVRTWAGRGIDFGAHSRTHRDLTALSDDDLEAEVTGSGDDLRALLQREVTTFAYPYGSLDARVRAAAGRCFDVAYGVEEGVNGPAADPLAVRRTMVQANDTLIDLELRLRIGRSPVHRARVRLGGMRRDLRQQWRSASARS